MPGGTEPGQAGPSRPAPFAPWDPTQYLRFADERLRPALDLLARVPLGAPAHVVDLGCGPGTVTSLLRQRFPAADVLGVDASAAMLDRARAAAPGCRFLAAELAALPSGLRLIEIADDTALGDLPVSSKFNGEAEFLDHLFQAGRAAAAGVAGQIATAVSAPA